jgi:hypothetical protein
VAIRLPAAHGCYVRKVQKRPWAMADLETPLEALGGWRWAILDSNQGPLPYQRSALTD